MAGQLAGAAAPVAIIVLALLMRTWRLELQGWTPDTYEQLSATTRLLAGEFPLSRYYPPGVALSMAPVLFFAPHTLASMQAVIIGSSLVVVAAAYILTVRESRSRSAAALAAGAIAVAPAFVYFSRDGLFDLVGAAWIVSAIALAPVIRGRSLPVVIAYGALLSVAINIRATDAAFLPALLVYWCDVGRRWRPRDVLGELRRREPIIAGGVMLGLSALYASSGGWMSTGEAGHVSAALYARHVALYVAAEFGGITALLVAPLALLGAVELWHRARTLLFVAVCMLVVWPLVHAPVPFASSRYMLPPLLFTLVLAAHSPLAMRRVCRTWPSAPRFGARATIVTMVALVGVFWCAMDAAMLYSWPARAANSDEAAYRQLRPVISALPPGSILVSTGTRGVRDSNTAIDYVDLIDFSRDGGNTTARIQALTSLVTAAREQRRPVFYLRTRLEANGDNLGRGGPGFDRYFEAVASRPGVVEVSRTSVRDFVLYQVN